MASILNQSYLSGPASAPLLVRPPCLLLTASSILQLTAVIILLIRITITLRFSMRKAHRPSLSNKYDQTANLAIDLETELTHSLVLPKILQKHQQHLFQQFAADRRADQDRMVTHLQGEVDKLKRQIIRLGAGNSLYYRLKTEDNYSNGTCQCLHPNPKEALPSQHLHPNPARNSEEASHGRTQRNTDRLVVETRQHLLRPSIAKSPFLDKENSSTLHIPSKVVLESKSRIGKEKLGKMGGAARRRFRKCVIAVYFCLLVPCLARRVYRNRLKAFIGQYPYEVSKYYLSKKEPAPSKFKKDENELWREMQEKMDFMEAVAQAQLSSLIKDVSGVRNIRVRFQELLNEELSSSSQKITNNHLDPMQQILHPQNVEHLLVHLLAIVGQMTDNFTQIVRNNFFQHNYETFAQNLLQGSFVNNSRPKLLGRVIQSGCAKMHPSREYLEVQGQDSEVALLTFDIFCRVYCYKWMNKLHKDKLTHKYSEHDTIIGNLLLSVLYLAGETLLDETIKIVVKTNQSLGEKPKYQSRKIRPILPLSIKKKYKGVNLQTKQLIADAPYFEEASAIALEHQETIHKLQQKMVSAGTELYQELSKKMREQKKRVRDETFLEKKILSQDKEGSWNWSGGQVEWSPNVGGKAEGEKEGEPVRVSRVGKESISMMVKWPRRC